MQHSAPKFATRTADLRKALRARAAGYYASATFVVLQVQDIPVWQDGFVVASHNGRLPVAFTEAGPVALLDNGELTAIAEWRLPAAQAVAA